MQSRQDTVADVGNCVCAASSQPFQPRQASARPDRLS